MNYIFYIFLGILLYFYFNLKEKLLIQYDITQMNRCKAYVCPTTPRPITDEYQDESDRRGDCYFQCIYTSLNMIDSIDSLGIDIISKLITDYMAQHKPPILGKPFLPFIDVSTGYDLDDEYNLYLFLTEEQIRNTPKRELVTRILERYENPMNNRITSTEMAFTNLIDLFSKLQPNSSRILIFATHYELYGFFFHVVVIARRDNSIFMLDPKHRVIMKNSDIWNNPWLNIKFYYDELSIRDIDEGIESFNWNLESAYASKSLYFFPVVNVESMLKSEYGGPDLSVPDSWSDVIRNDINPNFERDSIIISRLLREGDSGLSLSENQAYREWIRRLPDGNITDPRGQRALLRCAANVRPQMPPRKNEPCDPINDARIKICKRDQNCYHTYDRGEDTWKCERDELHRDDNITADQYCSVHNDKCIEGLECRVNDIGIGTCQ